MSILFLIIKVINSKTPSDTCPLFSGTDCMNCFSNTVNLSCGWCSSTKECIPGDLLGPLIGKCNDWIFETNQICKKESSIALPDNIRIFLGIFSFIIIIITLIFWIYIFPRCFTSSNIKNLQSVIV